MTDRGQQSAGGQGFESRQRGGASMRGGRGGARGARGRKDQDDDENWKPVTKLGHLVKEGKITSIEEIYMHSLPIKELGIVHRLLPKLKEKETKKDKDKEARDAVLKIKPVQKQTRAGQRTRFKAIVAVGDSEGHVGLATKTSKEVATAIRGAIVKAKLSIIPVRLGYWGNKIGKPHTVPCKVTGKCGSVRVRLIPAPRGTGIVGAPIPKKLLQFAGIKDCYTSAIGRTATKLNFAMATFNAIKRTSSYLTKADWKEHELAKTPYQVHHEFLSQKQNA